MTINHIVGDVTNTIESKGIKIIAHCCNNIGAWGRGVVLAISRRWGMPELIYRRWAQENPFEMRNSLGKIQIVPVERDIMVANIIGQNGIKTKNGIPPVRYDAIRSGLEKIEKFMENYKDKNPTLHMPRIGCGLAGGEWQKIEPIIEETISCPVYIYTLPHEVEQYNMVVKNDKP